MGPLQLCHGGRTGGEHGDHGLGLDLDLFLIILLELLLSLGGGFGSCLGGSLSGSFGRCLSGGLGGDLGLGGEGTGHVLIESEIAGVCAVGVVGGVLDAVLVDGHGNGSALTGVAVAVCRGQVACADVGEVQGLLAAGAGLGLDGHGRTLGEVVVASLVMAVVMAEEVGNVHIGCDLVDGLEPLQSVAVVAAALEQGHVGHNEQGLGVIQTLGCCHEISNGLGDLCVRVEAAVVTVVGAQVSHAQGVDIVVVVIGIAVDAVLACAVGQMAGLVQCDLIGGVVVSAAVVIGPNVADRDLTQNILDITGKGIGIAGGDALVAGEQVAAADDGADRQIVILDGGQNALQGALLFVAGAGVQISEDDCSVQRRCRILCCQRTERDHTDQHCRTQQKRHDFFQSLHNDLPP